MRVIIAGAGEVGFFLAKRLTESTNRVLIVDSDKNCIDEAEHELDAQTILGNITHRKILQEIACNETDLFLAVTGSDSENIIAASRAKRLGAKIAIARVDDPEFYPVNNHILSDEFGLDAIVCTSRILGLELLRKILCLEARKVFEFSGFGLNIMHYPIKESSKLVGMGIKSLKLPGNTKLKGLIRNNLFREVATIQKFTHNDELVVSGSIGDLFSLARQNFRLDDDAKAIIVGGGDVGLQLARYLEAHENKIEMIEISKRRCMELAATLRKTSVIHGSGSDTDLLEELSFDKLDYAVSVTGSDETNIMCSLIAKEMGVGHCFARLNQTGFEKVVDHLDVDDTAFTHESLLNLALSFHDTATTVKHVHTESSHDYFELRVPEINKKEFRLNDLELPSLVTLMGVVRNFHPLEPDVGIREGDSLIFSGPSNSIKYTIKSIRSICKN